MKSLNNWILVAVLAVWVSVVAVWSVSAVTQEYESLESSIAEIDNTVLALMTREPEQKNALADDASYLTFCVARTPENYTFIAYNDWTSSNNFYCRYYIRSGRTKSLVFDLDVVDALIERGHFYPHEDGYCEKNRGGGEGDE